MSEGTLRQHTIAENILYLHVHTLFYHLAVTKGWLTEEQQRQLGVEVADMPEFRELHRFLKEIDPFLLRT